MDITRGMSTGKIFRQHLDSSTQGYFKWIKVLNEVCEQLIIAGYPVDRLLRSLIWRRKQVGNKQVKWSY